jgi:hypothetical protein
MTLRTRKEASELWCPMARTARRESVDPSGTTTVVVAGCNTDALGRNRVPASCRCITTQCAMWRWSEVDSGDDRLGYCGLAGPAVHQ